MCQFAHYWWVISVRENECLRRCGIIWIALNVDVQFLNECFVYVDHCSMMQMVYYR